jgi:hypothetical protein
MCAHGTCLAQQIYNLKWEVHNEVLLTGCHGIAPSPPYTETCVIATHTSRLAHARTHVQPTVNCTAPLHARVQDNGRWAVPRWPNLHERSSHTPQPEGLLGPAVLFRVHDVHDGPKMTVSGPRSPVPCVACACEVKGHRIYPKERSSAHRCSNAYFHFGHARSHTRLQLSLSVV